MGRGGQYMEGGQNALLHQSSRGPLGAEQAADDDKQDAIRDWARAWASLCVFVRWG